jgi:hypothetical protein
MVSTQPQNNSSSESKCVLDVRSSIRELNPDPVSLNGTHRKVIRDPHIDATTDLQCKAVPPIERTRRRMENAFGSVRLTDHSPGPKPVTFLLDHI